MSALAIAPLLVPLATAALSAACGRSAVWQNRVSGLGSALFLFVACWLLDTVMSTGAVDMVFGNWPAPFGIVFRVDRVGAALILITALMGAACLLYQAGDIDAGTPEPRRLPLIHALLAGVAGAFATADLFNLYVWFELMLMAVLGLFALGAGRAALEACFKYLVLNLFGTLLLLFAIALIYGSTGHLQFDALSSALAALPPALSTLLLGLLGLAFLLKAGAVPLHLWLGAAYPVLSTPVLALVAGLLTKVGVYALLRTGDSLFLSQAPSLLPALGTIACLTMLIGVLGAAYHWDMRRILAFHIVSQIGYILLALALGGTDGPAVALFYTLHHILVKANLFLVAGLIFALCGSFDLRRCGGLYRARPALALLFAIPALSLVGIPPLSGFWAKFLLLDSVLLHGQYVWAALALLVSLLTLYSMMKVWMEAFWKDAPADTPGAAPGALSRPLPRAAWLACGSLAALTLAISLHPQALIVYSRLAALGVQP